MKTQKAAVISMVAQLFEIIENRKAAEKVEKELKEVLKGIMGEDATLEAGEFMVLLESRVRSDLDKKAILENEGPDFIAKYSKTTEYEILSVKSMARGGK